MMQGRMFRLVLGAFLLLLTANATAPRSSAQTPPNSKAYGHTLTEWLTKYVTWSVLGGPDTVGKVRFMPIPIGLQTGGSWTPEDPAVLEGAMDVTLKTGQAFVLPIAYFYGESYLPGFPQVDGVFTGYNPDPILPKSVFDSSEILIKMDGKAIIDSSKEDKFKYYVGPHFFDPPLTYSEPTSYGSTAATFFQGFGFVHQPLSKGKHTMTLESSLILPPGIYPNPPFSFAVKFKNTWTITVE